MEHHHINAQLTQLLKRGYSLTDAQKLLHSSQDMMPGQTALELVTHKHSKQGALNSQYHQARYAMRLLS